MGGRGGPVTAPMGREEVMRRDDDGVLHHLTFDVPPAGPRGPERTLRKGTEFTDSGGQRWSFVEAVERMGLVALHAVRVPDQECGTESVLPEMVAKVHRNRLAR